MIVRVASRMILLLAAIATATVLIVGAMALLASTQRPSTTTLLERDHVTAVKRAIEARPDQAFDRSPTPVIALVFAGIVMLATMPPVQRIHVHHRSYQRSDWI